jgi:hypothetical protein
MAVGNKNKNPTARQAQYVLNLVFDEDTQSLRILDLDELTMNIDDSTTADVVYQGWASPGTATSDAGWKIKKMSTASGLITTWADGNTLFDNVWDDIASLSYS